MDPDSPPVVLHIEPPLRLRKEIFPLDPTLVSRVRVDEVQYSPKSEGIIYNPIISPEFKPRWCCLFY